MHRAVSEVVAVVLLISVALVAATSIYFWMGAYTTPQPTAKKPVPIIVRPVSTEYGVFAVTNGGTESMSLTYLSTSDGLTCTFVNSTTINAQGSGRCFMPPKRGTVSIYGTTSDGRTISPYPLSMSTDEVSDISMFVTSTGGGTGNLTYTVNYVEGLKWVNLTRNGTYLVNNSVSSCGTFYTNRSNYSYSSTYVVLFTGCDGNTDSKTYVPR